MADAPTRAQRAAALDEKRRRLEDLKKRRNLRDEDTSKQKPAANLDEYIDGLLSASAAGMLSASGEEPGQVQQASPRATSTESANREKADASPQLTNIATTPQATLQKQIEVFTISTQTVPDEFIDIPDVEEEEAVERSEKQHVDQRNGASEAAEADELERQPVVLPIESVRKDVASEAFVSFINTASKKVERMLGAPMMDDLLADYVGASDRNKEQKSSDESRFISSRQIFECANWTPGRDVTDIDWSLLHRDLFLSTHQMPTSTTGGNAFMGSTAVSSVSFNETSSSSMTPRTGELQSDGLALIWSLTMPSRPEHIFTCGSPVTCGRFHPTEPTLVIGGCESGQIVVWDTRAGRLPVQKSSLMSVVGASIKGHTHPIGFMDAIEGGLGLVTSSSDGRVNYWSLANLREPADSVQISDSVSCFAIVPESEVLLVGDDFGSLYTVQSSSQSTNQRSSRKQVRKLETMDTAGNNFGHYGMVNSLSTKALKKGAAIRVAALSKGFLRGSGGLTLSCSVDWTVKLWAPAYSETPLLSMVSHSYDYMSDVKWCPTHPSVFATASSNGTLGLWNLTKSLEEPLTGPEGIVIEPDAMSGRGLNKLRWSSDGRRIAVSSGDQVHVLNMTEEVIRPKGDEDTRLMNQLVARGLLNRQ
ncbi:hypothetical protein MPSEU_000900300 [Mayamaea pseudoterrestris]|nr:hypothetical protein MPSEU_000900300 [Mayamaea pseudoterrestris]